MNLQLRKKHNVQKTTTTTVTATGTLTTVTTTRSTSMKMAATTKTKSQPCVNVKAKLKDWWKSTYPAKYQQKRSQKLGQALALEILRRQRSDGAQHNSSSSGESSSSSSGSSTIVAALRVLKSKTKTRRELQDDHAAREPQPEQEEEDHRTKNPILPTILPTIRSHLHTLLTRKFIPAPKKATRRQSMKRRARALSNAVATWRWRMSWKAIAKKVAQKIFERDRIKICSLRFGLQQGLVVDLEVRPPLFLALMILFGILCLWALLAVGKYLRG